MQTEIYFAECSGRIKVGITSHLKARLSQLRTGAGAPVTLIASVAGSVGLEQAIHKKLKPFRADREWYHDCLEVRAAIQNSLNNFPVGRSSTKEPTLPLRKFGAVARILWPAKTAAHIAAIAGRDERTAKRWLSGEFEPPISVVLAVVNETFRVQ